VSALLDEFKMHCEERTSVAKDICIRPILKYHGFRNGTCVNESAR
jgi:hypothetical protein